MKRMRMILAFVLVLIMVSSALPVFAAPEYLTVKNFKEIYPASNKAAEITEASNGAQITFHKVDSRVTLVGTGTEPGDDEWGRLMDFNGLVMEFSGINFPKPTTKTNGVTLAFTFSQEAGSFYATGSTGVHIRIFYTVDGMSIYMKSAPAPDTEAYYPMSGISWERFPSKLTFKVYKSGNEYIFKFNEVECRVPADKIEMDLSRSGKCFVNIGVMGIQDRDSSLIVNRIYNDPALTAAPTTTTKKPDNTTTKKPDTSKTPAASTTTTAADATTTMTAAPDSSQPVLTGPSTMKADSKIARIDGANMAIKAKPGITVADFANAFTIDEGYEIAVFDENGTRLEGTASIADGKTVKVLGGEQSFAEFTLELMQEAAPKGDEDADDKGGAPIGLIIGIVAAVVVLAGGAVAVWFFVIKKKNGAAVEAEEVKEEVPTSEE